MDKKNYLTYPYDYFTGNNARVFFGHVWVDDIVTLQYTTSQSKTPIYGYSSVQFDAVAQGQFIVNGNFTLAFKETGYLNLVDRELKNNKFETKSTKKKEKQKRKDILKYWTGKGKPIEQVLDEAYSSNNGEASFENLAESLEDYIWDNYSDIKHTQIIRADNFDYDGRGIDRDGFDIVITFGDYLDPKAEHTVKAINDIHIIGESMILTPDGSPVGLNYTFFARGIDEKIDSSFRVNKDKKSNEDEDDNELNNALNENTNNAVRPKKALITKLSGPSEDNLGYPLVIQNPLLSLNISNPDNYNLNKSTDVDRLKSDEINPAILNALNFIDSSSTKEIVFEINIDDGTYTFTLSYMRDRNNYWIQTSGNTSNTITNSRSDQQANMTANQDINKQTIENQQAIYNEIMEGYDDISKITAKTVS